jgi:hypothetical protein
MQPYYKTIANALNFHERASFGRLVRPRRFKHRCTWHSSDFCRNDRSPRFSALPVLSNYYCWKTGGGPLTRFHFRLTFTSTRLAILMKGMLLFIP